MHSVSKRVRLSELTVKIWMKIDLYCQRQRCSPNVAQWLAQWLYANKVCADIRGLHWIKSVKRQWGNRNMNFHGFRPYVFSALRNETSVIICNYLIPCRLNSTDPEIYDLGWLWKWLECSLYVTVLRFAILPSVIFFLLIYCRVCLPVMGKS